MANVDQCEAEPDLARKVNAELPERIAAACSRRGMRLIHISTDAVFDGRKAGSYAEADDPTPAGVYAATKCAGESSVMRVNPGAIVARVNFYGWSLSGQRSLAEFFVNNLSGGKAVNGFTDVIFCPMYVRHLAETLVQMLQVNLHGIYHVVGRNPMSKFEFGVAIARTFGLREDLISAKSVEKSGLIAPRAHNLNLSIHKLSTDLGNAVPDFFTGLAQFYSEYQQGYPQRIRSYQHRPAVDGEKVPGAAAPTTSRANGSGHGN
jgi:dTDP-4-dehydrorhamnose reductase